MTLGVVVSAECVQGITRFSPVRFSRLIPAGTGCALTAEPLMRQFEAEVDGARACHARFPEPKLRGRYHQRLRRQLERM